MELTQRKWHGRWIQHPALQIESVTAPYMRGTFTLDKRPQKATAYVCAPGWHEVYVNGRKVDDRVLSPVVTQFDKHVSYIEYDIAPLLREGRNAIVLHLGNGLYNCTSNVIWNFPGAPWRGTVRAMCDVEVDGVIVAKTGRSWKTALGPVRRNALREGETYDFNYEIPGFAEADFDDSAWENAMPCHPAAGLPVLEELEPCRIMEQIEPVAKREIVTSFLHATVFDFGTAMAGWCAVSFKNARALHPGASIRIVYADALHENGTVDHAGMDAFTKDATFQTEIIILPNSGTPATFEWQPHFTYHGFRYAQVSYGPGDVQVDDVNAKACVVHNGFKSIGTFASSDDTLNALQRITRRSYVSNFVGIPTDCPHREKNGWTGDAQLAMQTGLWNFDATKAYNHFIQILVDGQRLTGQLSGIAPNAGWGYDWGSGPAWDAVLFEAAWQLYVYRGDDSIIRNHYDAMKRYLEFCETMDEDGLMRFGLGDWCAYDKAPDIGLTSSAIVYSDAMRFAEFARMRCDSDDAQAAESLASRLKDAINAEYMHGGGHVADDELTSLACVLFYNLCPEAEKESVLRNLVERVRANGHIADFGILGAKWVPRVLAENGFADDAHAIITQSKCPGWGNWLKRGATTLWEDWSGVSSRNHIMFGDISAWMFEYPGGIQPRAFRPGFRHFHIAPKFIRALDWVAVSYESPCGLITSKWKREGGAIRCEFGIPESSAATIILPDKTLHNVNGFHEFVIEDK